MAVRLASGLAGEPHRLATAGYHGSYVASAIVELPQLRKVLMLSVHASPSRPDDRDVQRWLEPGPPKRTMGERYDADFVWGTVSRLSEEDLPILVAGDWNEARRWDCEHGGTWGKEFFDRVADSDLDDCTWRLWGQERPTCGEYQIDHIFASRRVGALIDAIEIDWQSGTGASDHAQLVFSLDTGRASDR